jgi:hypothetical protein
MTRIQQIILDDLEKHLRHRITEAIGDFQERCNDSDIPDKMAALSVLTIFSYFLTIFAIRIIGVEPADVARLVFDAAKLMAKRRDQEEKESAND